jgi:hypothetical protein
MDPPQDGHGRLTGQLTSREEFVSFGRSPPARRRRAYYLRSQILNSEGLALFASQSELHDPLAYWINVAYELQTDKKIMAVYTVIRKALAFANASAPTA